jgi:hypothetical protein
MNSRQSIEKNQLGNALEGLYNPDSGFPQNGDKLFPGTN